MEIFSGTSVLVGDEHERNISGWPNNHARTNEDAGTNGAVNVHCDISRNLRALVDAGRSIDARSWVHTRDDGKCWMKLGCYVCKS